MSLRLEEKEYLIFAKESYIYHIDYIPELTYDSRVFLVYENTSGILEYYACRDEVVPCGYPFPPTDFFSNSAIPFHEIEFNDISKEDVKKMLKREYIKMKMERELGKGE